MRVPGTVDLGGQADVVTVGVTDIEDRPDRVKGSGRGLLVGLPGVVGDLLHSGLGRVPEDPDAFRAPSYLPAQ
jgi:hypothetical protein